MATARNRVGRSTKWSRNSQVIHYALAVATYLPITYLNYPVRARAVCSPRKGKLMSGRMKPVWRITVLYGIVLGLVLTLPACTDFKKDFLCRPEGICVNAPDGGHGVGP